MRPGCINKAKEICNYESGLEIHGCPRHLHLPFPPLLSVALSDVSAYPHHRVRAEFHGEGVPQEKLKEAQLTSMQIRAVPVPASSQLPTKHCTIPMCGFALATFSAREMQRKSMVIDWCKSLL